MFTKNNIIMAIVFGGAALGFSTYFVADSIASESNFCHDAGYGDYDSEAGVCKPDPNSSFASNIVIVAGNTANTPMPNIAPSTITYKYLQNSLAAGANVKIVSAASDLAIYTIEPEHNKTNDAEGFVDSIENNIAMINEKISQVPSSDGVTYLEAISKAGRDTQSAVITQNYSSLENDGSAIIVIGSGLSDGGVLNFADYGLLSKTPADVLSAMDNAKQLSKNLDGIKIVWSGIGQVANPQDLVSDSEIDNIESIYKQILERKGAKVTFDNSVRALGSIPSNPHKVKITTTKSTGIVFELGDEELSFVADTAEIKDERQAADALGRVIKEAIANPDKIIRVTGYMAPEDCHNKANTSLSGARAEKVKHLLQGAGVTNKIEVNNGGVYKPEVSVCDDAGRRIESFAQSKRKVVIEFN